MHQALLTTFITITTYVITVPWNPMKFDKVHIRSSGEALATVAGKVKFANSL
jgi:hypothetical protein